MIITLLYFLAMFTARDDSNSKGPNSLAVQSFTRAMEYYPNFAEKILHLWTRKSHIVLMLI